MSGCEGFGGEVKKQNCWLRVYYVVVVVGSFLYQDFCCVVDEEMEVLGGLSNFFKVVQLVNKRDGYLFSSLILEFYLKLLCKVVFV